MSLRSRIIKLAHDNVALRPHLLPILKEAGAEIANTILQQMGGTGRIRAMTGAKQFVALPNGVQFKWPAPDRGKPNTVRILLEPSDTYTVEFYNGLRKMSTHSDIYNEDLKKLFEQQTGLYLSL